MKNSIIQLLLAFVFAWTAQAENWPQWRGPYLNGSTTEKGLVDTWSKTENVVWVTPLPGYSGSTPVIWNDHVFVSSPDEQKNLLFFCLDRKTGKVRWQRKVVENGDIEKGRNNSTSPSPVTDGKVAVVMYATGDVAAFDFDGKELWTRQLASEYGKFQVNWIYGSSPMLHDGKLYIQVLQHQPPEYAHALDDKPSRESFLLCLDFATGKTLWRHVRSTDAVSEAQESYATPIPHPTKDGIQIIVVGGDYVTAHSLVDGAEIWRCGGLNVRKEKYWRIVPSPVGTDGLIFASGPKRDPLLAIKDDGKGLVTSTHLAWQSKEYSTDCVTPLLYQGKLFILDGDRQVITCVDPVTSEKKWQGNLGVREIFRASPTGADGKLYCISESGTAVVLEAGPEFKILSTIRMEEQPVRSSIPVSHGQLFIRTGKNLYCIGKS